MAHFVERQMSYFYEQYVQFATLWPSTRSLKVHWDLDTTGHPMLTLMLYSNTEVKAFLSWALNTCMYIATGLDITHTNNNLILCLRQ